MENLDKVKKYYNFEFTDEWGVQDFYIYEESTADGYSVYVAIDDPKKGICVGENVYYYDSDLQDALVDHIKYSSKLDKDIIYVDDLNSFYVEEAIDVLNELMEDELSEKL